MRTPTLKVVTAASISSTLRDQLDDYALSNGHTRSWVVSKALEDFLASTERESPPKQR